MDAEFTVDEIALEDLQCLNGRAARLGCLQKRVAGGSLRSNLELRIHAKRGQQTFI